MDPEPVPEIREVLPRFGKLYVEEIPEVVMCKPKIMPLKSFSLQKTEKIQHETQEIVRTQEKIMKTYYEAVCQGVSSTVTQEFNSEVF